MALDSWQSAFDLSGVAADNTLLLPALIVSSSLVVFSVALWYFKHFSVVPDSHGKAGGAAGTAADGTDQHVGTFSTVVDGLPVRRSGRIEKKHKDGPATPLPGGTPLKAIQETPARVKAEPVEYTAAKTPKTPRTVYKTRATGTATKERDTAALTSPPRQRGRPRKA